MNGYDKIIVIGCSAGGLKALLSILKPLAANFPYAIIIVQHIARYGETLLIEVLAKSLKLPVFEAIAEEKPKPGNVYVAPGDYHLLFEKDGSFNVSLDEKVTGSRPSIKVLFETAVETFGSKLVAIILTGNSTDGADSIQMAVSAGATVFIQNPESADYPALPSAAVQKTNINTTYTPQQIGKCLRKMGKV